MFKQAKLEKLSEQITAMGFHPFIRDGILFVSAEYGDDAADYYGEFRGGYAWINPKLEDLAKKNNAFWEWQNPGCIGIFQ